MLEKVFMYKRFERFWHWAQALLIFFLAFTGFEVHGSYVVFGFKNAVILHTAASFILLILAAFAIFWHFTTGEWRQYIPTTYKLKDQLKYYLIGIFKGESHPHKKSVRFKLNALQRLTYVGFKIFLLPIMGVTGLIYFFAAHGDIHMRNVKYIGIIHSFGAFVFIAFIIIHVYMTTTGHTPTSHLKAMITGWDEVEVEEDGKKD